MQHILTFGDVAIYYDSNTKWYYVKHATTDRILMKTRNKAAADIVASVHSDFKGDSRKFDENDSIIESRDEPFYYYH